MRDAFEEYVRKDLESKGVATEKAAQVVRDTFSGTKATPRPWHVGMKPMAIYDAEGAEIANMHIPMLPMDEHKANAALIVRAVNAHDDLVKAARQIEEDLADGGVDLSRVKKDEPIPVPAYKLCDLIAAVCLVLRQVLRR